MGDSTSMGWTAALDAVAAAADTLGARVWIVGGALRDILLGRTPGDLDLAVTCAPAALAETLRAGAHRPTVARLNRASVRVGLWLRAGESPLQLDISPLHGPDIAADLARRDFTCNALALPLSARIELLTAAGEASLDARARRAALPSLVDLPGGVRDIEERTLRLASDLAFSDEPGRIFRAARMLATCGFSTAAELRARAAEAAPLLARLAPERIREEMNALLAQPACAEGLRFLASVEALATLVPMLAGETAGSGAIASVAATHSLQAEERPAVGDVEPFVQLGSLAPLRRWYAARLPEGIQRVVALRWGLLIAAPMPPDGAALERDREPLRASNPDLVRLSKQVRATVDAVAAGASWQARLTHREPSPAELRMAADRWRDGFVDLLTGAAARAAACPPDALVAATRPAEIIATRVRGILEQFFTDREAFIPPSLLDGVEVIDELTVTPGPEVGRVLRSVREAQLAGEIATRGEALALARRLITMS